ncbi:MAG: hypothetical protein R3F59_25115 [Myxococcota bacterium]
MSVTLPTDVAERGLGMLVAQVHYEAGERRTDTVNLQGQFVEADAVGLLPSTGRFSAVMGEGPIDDPHDHVEIDEERDARGEVVR